jgi:hypothetical protein
VKIFILSDNMSDGGPPWINVLWPMLKVFEECLDVTHIQVPQASKPHGSRILAPLKKREATRHLRQQWTAQVREKIDPAGPNILMVWGAGIHWAHLLEPVWDLFSHRVLHILDTLQPDHVPRPLLNSFDLVSCFCSDLAESFGKQAKVATLFFPAHLDTLNFHNRGAYRPIDLLVVGRRVNQFHEPLYTHFNTPQCERVFIDFVTRSQTPMTREAEFRLLMSAHGKSSAAFCYEPGGVPRYRGCSPLLERWIHAWSSGCTVFGTRPRGGGTAELQDWPESTIELPDNPQESIDMVEALLSDREGMTRRRNRNVLEAVRRHDTRRRIALLLSALALPEPDKLKRGLERLSALETQLQEMPFS